ncbi:MAG: hypothetical protein JXP73_18840 [Deltaproteobacteria bacterium]|nr:hypothetical protein [Deltaproteobacteria bacterium]
MPSLSARYHEPPARPPEIRMPSSRLIRTPPWLLFVLALGLFYFYSGGGPNQGSRFNLDRAILAEGRLAIESYHTNTEDKALYRGIHYSDKAPGTSFVALPVLAASRAFLRMAGVDPESASGLSVQLRMATWSTATLPALLLCCLVFGWVVRLGHSRIAAANASLALGLASPLWAYGTLFWSNALAGLCIVYATSAVLEIRRARHPHPMVGAAALAGAVAGWAVLTEFPIAPMAVALFVLLLVALRPWGVYWRRLLWFAAGALAVAAILGAYNQAAFGSPLRLGYGNVEGWDDMKRGLFGVRWPRPEAMAGILWGSHGLLVTGPLLLLGLAGHVVSLVRGRNRFTMAVCLAFSVYPFLLNSSYAYWDGGWSYGPRHMSAAFPFLALGLAPLYDALPRWSRAVAMVALLGGIFMTTVAVGTHGMTPHSNSNPLADLYWAAFQTGHYAKHTGWVDTGGPATNWGLAFGLGRARSLIPLWIGLGIGLSGLFRSLLLSPRSWRHS